MPDSDEVTCPYMEQQIDLTRLSLDDELRHLSSRVEQRIKEVSGAAADSAAAHAGRGSHGRTGGSPCGGMPSNSSTPKQETLSERVKDLIQTNDPEKGSGVGPLRWSRPFYGGSIIRDPVAVDTSAYVPKPSDAAPPFFGGPPCTSCGTGEVPASHTSSPSEMPSVSRHKQPVQCPELCVICYSPCGMADNPHGLHTCERHRLL